MSRWTQLLTFDFYPIAAFTSGSASSSGLLTTSSYSNWVHSWFVLCVPPVAHLIYWACKGWVYADVQQQHSAVHSAAKAAAAAMEEEEDGVDGSESGSDSEEEESSGGGRSSVKQRKNKPHAHSRGQHHQPLDEFEDSHTWLSFLEFERLFITLCMCCCALWRALCYVLLTHISCSFDVFVLCCVVLCCLCRVVLCCLCC